MFSVKYFCSQQIVVEEEIQEVEPRFCRAQFTGMVMHLAVCYTIGEKKGYFYGRVSRKISFLTIPPHSQLIHNYDAEVYAPIKVELRFRRAQFTATVMHLAVCYTIGEK